MATNTCLITKPHSLCTSPPTSASPVDSLDASLNGNQHQLISCNKSGSSTNRPILCIQQVATGHHTQLLSSTSSYSSACRDCVRLRGLPYEVSYEEIVAFLGEYSSQIVYQGIHMIYNMLGHSSGEAFVQMQSEYAASQTALAKHHKYMIFGKKQRYIEVFQCSLDDMLNGHFNMNGTMLNASGQQMTIQHALNANNGTMISAPSPHYYLQHRASPYFHPVLYFPNFPMSPPITPIYGSQVTMPNY